MSNSTESACIYELLEITDDFFTHLRLDVSNHTLNFSLELKNRVWYVDVFGFYELPHEEMITRGKIARSCGHLLSPCKEIVLEIFNGVMKPNFFSLHVNIVIVALPLAMLPL